MRRELEQLARQLATLQKRFERLQARQDLGAGYLGKQNTWTETQTFKPAAGSIAIAIDLASGATGDPIDIDDNAGTALFNVQQDGRTVVPCVVSGAISLNDDTASSITPVVTSGLLLMSTTAVDTTIYAIVHFRVTATNNHCQAVSVGSNLNTATTTLAGTTGTDTKFTIAAATDGKLYFENRRGATLAIRYTIFG